MRVGVIGAGLGGLAAAAHLVGSGHDVTVYERGASPGGLAVAHREAGFRLDVGPTVITMPETIGEAFAALGVDLRQVVPLTALDPIYRAVFADGSEFRVRAGREAMVEEVRSFAGPREAANFEVFADWLTDLYELEMPNFIDTQFDTTRDLARRWRPLLRLVRHVGVRRLDQAVASYLEDPRLQRVFSFQSLYAGVAPQRALSLYAVITYLDTIAGVWQVDGGTPMIATALADALADRGAKFEYGTPVTGILRNGDGAVDAIQVEGDRRVPLDAVVANADPGAVYRSLLDVKAPRSVRRATYSPSCIVWSAGVAGSPPPGATQHNIHFGWAWEEAFEALSDGARMPDPSTLVTVGSLGDPTAAPTGSSTLFALEPVPNLEGAIDWTSDGGRIVDDLRARVGRLGYPTGEVVVERSIDPLNWRTMGLERGTPFSLAHTLGQTGPFRPRNVDGRVPGLAFAGAGTVPGVGVPMVMLSGKLAAQRIDTYAAATRTVRW